MKPCLPLAFIVLTWVSANAQSEPILDTYRYGGVHFLSWTSRSSHEGHTLLLSLQNKERVRQLDYVVTVSGLGMEPKVVDEGEFRTLRENSYEILSKRALPDHARITACASYYNIPDSQHYASVSFFREPDILAAGRQAYAAGPSLETAIPVRLRHDGSLTCRTLMAEGKLDPFLQADRLPLPEADGEIQKEESDNPDNISLITLTSWLVNNTEHSLEGLITAPEDIADVEYLVRVVEPAQTPGPNEWTGRLPFVNAHTYIDFALSNPEHNLDKRLPAADTTLDVCLAYYQLSEMRFARERWQAHADYKRVQQFKNTTLPQTMFPKDDIVVEYSQGKLGCPAS